MKDNKLENRATIQSFDPRTLRYLHDHPVDVELVYLVEEDAIDFSLAMDKLGCSASVYSPPFSLVDRQLRDATKKRDMKLIPWTVNDVEDILRMLDHEVDGIITDYPDKFPLIYRR